MSLRDEEIKNVAAQKWSFFVHNFAELAGDNCHKE